MGCGNVLSRPNSNHRLETTVYRRGGDVGVWGERRDTHTHTARRAARSAQRTAHAHAHIHTHTYRSSKWHYRRRHFYFRVNYASHSRCRYRRKLFWNLFFAADADTAVLCSFEEAASQINMNLEIVLISYPEDPTVLKKLRDGELLRRSVFTMPPQILLRLEALFEEKIACKTQENFISAGGGRHSKSLCDSKFTTCSKLTTAWYFRYGRVLWVADTDTERYDFRFFSATNSDKRYRHRVRKRGLLEKGSFQKTPFSRLHFLEILENLEILVILENPQTVENKEILENLEILEILETPQWKDPFRNDPFSRSTCTRILHHPFSDLHLKSAWVCHKNLSRFKSGKKKTWIPKVTSPFCPVCPWDGWGFIPGTIVPQGLSEKCLRVFCLLVFLLPRDISPWRRFQH